MRSRLYLASSAYIPSGRAVMAFVDNAYLLTGDEKYLSIRQFSDSQKREAYERQNGICPNCKQHFEIEQMEGDHIDPWHSGGKTDAANCQMLCKHCNRLKSGK